MHPAFPPPSLYPPAALQCLRFTGGHSLPSPPPACPRLLPTLLAPAMALPSPPARQVSQINSNIDQHTSSPPLISDHPNLAHPPSLPSHFQPHPPLAPSPFPITHQEDAVFLGAACWTIPWGGNHLSPVVQDAMDRFTRAMRAAKGPLTLTAMARAWDEHARAAVMHVLAASAPPNACWHAVVGPWHECAADVAHG
ncbi:unnamed protein product [Closterium sp. Naga37s-1]|nr:unnamed protein product [Closterium sp. Naga37s-1]